MISCIKFSLSLLAVLALCPQFALAVDTHCLELFNSLEVSKVTEKQLTQQVYFTLKEVLEFSEIESIANALGVRVWIYGDAASNLLHYVKSQLQNRSPQKADEFIHIFNTTEEILLSVDGSNEQINQMEAFIHERLTYASEQYSYSWKIKRLQDQSFIERDSLIQDTDSQSIGMIEISHSPKEPIIRDINRSSQGQSLFLRDAVQDRITYLEPIVAYPDSSLILPVLKFLTNAFRYHLRISAPDWLRLKETAQKFDPNQNISTDLRNKIGTAAKKLILQANDLEATINGLDQLGLREKLIAFGNPREKESFAWWLNREPLRSLTLNKDRKGRTARHLRILKVAHKTTHFSSSQSITKNLNGLANVFISRKNSIGETASYGDGFYTYLEDSSFRVTGFITRFEVHPEAEEGRDFISQGRNILIFRNKNALTVIPNHPFLDINDLIEFSQGSSPITYPWDDLRWLEIQRWHFRPIKWIKELEALHTLGTPEALDRIKQIYFALNDPKVSDLLPPRVRNWTMNSYLHFEETSAIKRHAFSLSSSLDHPPFIISEPK